MIGRKEILLPNRYLHEPKDFLERIVRSNGSTSTTGRDMDVVVVACSDPRIADVIKDIAAKFIRLPGVEADPSWVGFKELLRRPPRAMVFLCHTQCLAHDGVMGRAQSAVQRSSQDFWKRFGRAGGAWLAGKIDVESRHINFISESGEAWEPSKLLRTIPVHSGEALVPLLEMNETRRKAIIPRGTTPLHPSVGVLAISIAGALDNMRERNLAYVVDYVGQSLDVFTRQVGILGNICLINAHRPHLALVAPAEQTEEARAILAYALSVCNEMERGNCFTAELVVRHSSGSFTSVAFHDAIGAEVR